MIDTTTPHTVDFAAFRAHFPALLRTVEGRSPAYLDNPAGTQVPRELIEAMNAYFVEANANLHGVFRTTQASSALFDEAHAAMADLLGAASPQEIIFGQNMTTLTFAISRAIGRTLQQGDEIVITRLDHDGNVAPWRALEERGAVLRVVDIHPEDCTLDMDDLRAKIGPKTKVVAVTHCSNLVGSIVDVREVCRLARAAGAISYIDAVQYAAHGPIDVQAYGCDFLACSSYKFFGPHLGIVYGRRELLEQLQAYKVRPADDVPPGKFETGTLNFEGTAGLLGTFHYLESIGEAAGAGGSRREKLLAALRAMQAFEATLGARLIAGLQGIPGVKVWGITDPQHLDQRVPTVSFTMQNQHPAEIAEALAAAEIYVWNGNNYAVSLTERLDLERSGGMVRVGPVHYNTTEEVDRALAVVAQLAG